MCKEKTDLFDTAKGLEQFDQHLRPSLEAIVIHILYCDLWDVSNDDPVAWSRTTFSNIIAFVERDRQAVATSETNQLVSAFILYQMVILCIANAA